MIDGRNVYADFGFAMPAMCRLFQPQLPMMVEIVVQRTWSECRTLLCAHSHQWEQSGRIGSTEDKSIFVRLSWKDCMECCFGPAEVQFALSGQYEVDPRDWWLSLICP